MLYGATGGAVVIMGHPVELGQPFGQGGGREMERQVGVTGTWERIGDDCGGFGECVREFVARVARVALNPRGGYDAVRVQEVLPWGP